MSITTTSESASKSGGAVTAMVLNWNGLAATAACCRDLAPVSRSPHRLLVIDNGSTQHDLTALRTACPSAGIIATGRNLGFAGGINYGIRHAMQHHHPDYFWLLNNDVRTTPASLPALLAAMDENPQTGIVAGDMPDGSWNLTRVLRIPVPVKVDRSPDYVSGACMLIRREVFDSIGLFDEDYFFFFEDADFCHRARLSGWQLAVAVNTGIRHTGAATIGRNGYERSRYYRSGHRRFLRKTTRLATPRAAVCLAWRMTIDAFSGNREAVRGNLDGWHEAAKA